MPGRARLHALVAAFADVPPNAYAMTSAIRDTCDPATANRQPPTANRQPPTDNPSLFPTRPSPPQPSTTAPTAFPHPTEATANHPTPSILMPREPRVALVLDLLQQVVE
ncbi:hypothetical protein Y603_4912 [Burkholderia pseudomallei MSHR1153]|nr:hypothetical protein Y603_4912 [Burkholderia pseudomallei MSHR1153]